MTADAGGSLRVHLIIPRCERTSQSEPCEQKFKGGYIGEYMREYFIRGDTWSLDTGSCRVYRVQGSI